MSNTLKFLRTIVGIVFLLASFDKLQNPGDFAVIVDNYRILPAMLVNPVAVLLPWVEFLCGLALIFNVMARGAALIVTLLMGCFLAALTFNYARGIDVACGCFTTDPDGGAGTLWTLLRDAAIGLTSLIVFWMFALEERKSR